MSANFGFPGRNERLLRSKAKKMRGFGELVIHRGRGRTALVISLVPMLQLKLDGVLVRNNRRAVAGVAAEVANAEKSINAPAADCRTQHNTKM